MKNDVFLNETSLFQLLYYTILTLCPVGPDEPVVPGGPGGPCNGTRNSLVIGLPSDFKSVTDQINKTMEWKHKSRYLSLQS